MAGYDERHRIRCHGLADITRRSGLGAQYFGQRAIRGRLAPAEFAHLRVDFRKEGLLRTQIERHCREIHPFPFKVTVDIADEPSDVRRRNGASGLRKATQDRGLGPRLRIRRQAKATHALRAPSDGRKTVLCLEDCVLVLHFGCPDRALLTWQALRKAS